MFSASERRPLLPDARQTYDGVKLFRAELAAVLMPGQSAPARRVYCSGGQWIADTHGPQIMVYDALGLCCAFPAGNYGGQADRIWVVNQPDMTTWTAGVNGAEGAEDANRYETLAEFGLTRMVKLTAALAYGGSAAATIYVDNGGASVSTGQSITVYDWILSSGDSASIGKQGWARYDEHGLWRLISMQCG
jgi:hypothetical protein